MVCLQLLIHCICLLWNENAKGLDEPTAQFFHHNVANLLFLCKRACRDIQTAVAFLCTIEKCPDVDG